MYVIGNVLCRKLSRVKQHLILVRRREEAILHFGLI